MREYLIDGVPLRDPRGKWMVDYTASSLFSEVSRTITSGSAFGFHGESSQKENYFGTGKETLVINVLGDDKEEHNQLLRGFQGLFARKDFPVLSSPQRTALVTENAISDFEPDAITDWSGNSLALVTAPWDATKTAAQTTAGGSFIQFIFSRRNTVRVFKAGETIKVTAKVAASNPARQFWLSPHSRTPNAYPTTPQASLTPITAGASWQTVSFTSVLSSDIALGQADVAVVTTAVPPLGETMTMGDVTFESLSHPGRDNRSFNVATDLQRSARFRTVGSAAIDRINEKTARVTWIVENLSGFYYSVAEFTTSPVVMATASQPMDLTTLASDSNAPLNSGTLRFRGPLSIGGLFKATDSVTGKSIGVKPTVALLTTEYVLVDLATLQATKVTSDTWSTAGGTDWTPRIEIGGEGAFAVEPGTPASDWPVGGFKYLANITASGHTTASAVEFRFKRSYLS